MTATDMLAEELSPLGWANTRFIFLSNFISSTVFYSIIVNNRILMN